MTFKQTLMIAVMCGISLSANARMLGKDFYSTRAMLESCVQQ